MARRYHWHSAVVQDFTSEPHTAVVGEHQGTITNLVDSRAKPAQHAMLTIVQKTPDSTLAEFKKLVLPRHHDIRVENIDSKRLGAVLAVAHQREFQDFASLLLLENLGPRTLQSLALIAEVIHGAPTRFSDPARFSFAHGGKDGHPLPVPLKTYDESLSALRRSLDSAKLGYRDKVDGFKRLDSFVRCVEESTAPRADVRAAIAHERAISGSIGGRTVFDDKRKSPSKKQLSLFDQE